MSYVARINPFAGILCNPYYYLWATVIIAWVQAGFQWLYLIAIEQLQREVISRQTRAQSMLKVSINKKIRKQCKSILQKALQLPAEIVDIIIEMTSDPFAEYPNWQKIGNYLGKLQRYDKINEFLRQTIFIYPVIRIITHFVNFCIIMVQYFHWYRNNGNASNWDKYNAFIISLFYLPIWKATGCCVIIGGYPRAPIDEYRLLYIGMTECGLFLIFFVVSACPIFIPGVFIYLPTTIMALIMGGCIYGLFYVCFKDETFSLLASSTFITVWFVTISTICTMELWSGNGWVETYKIGFIGYYCDEKDYLDFVNFNDYSLGVQFLIVSWFLF